MLGDAASILTDPCLGLSTDFPWAFVFATFATLFTFCLEYFLQRYFRARLGLPQIAGASYYADTHKLLTPCLHIQQGRLLRSVSLRSLHGLVCCVCCCPVLHHFT